MNDALEIRVPRNLRTPNATRGAHWRVRHRETQNWQHDLAFCAPQGWGEWSLLEAVEFSPDRRGRMLLRAERRRERRRVTITRFVPRSRDFIRDADNLAFAPKPLNDALVRLHLLTDDSERWLECIVLQVIAEDRAASTLIRIERVQTSAQPIESVNSQQETTP